MKRMGEQAIIISDHGKDNILKRIRRKMAVHNHIPSNKNISTNWLGTKKHIKIFPLKI